MEGLLRKVLVVLILGMYWHDDVSSRHIHTTQKLVNYSISVKRDFKKSLGFNEDAYLNFTELTSKYKYPTEQHTVVTDDGYILTVFRILPKCNVTRGFPILLMHGLYDSSDEWIVTGPDSGFGYILAKKCYDVWAANHRGNVYSREHVSLNPNKDVKYWNYTFDEHGFYDLPALVDYIVETTRLTKINYIGHSQGTTDFFVMASLRPEYNEKVQISFHLAPVAWMKNIKSPIPKLAAPVSGSIRAFLDDVGYRELFAKHQILHTILEYVCNLAPDDLCGAGLSITTGYKRGNIASRNIAVALSHLFFGTSSKDLDHLGQLIATGRFRRYDEGRQGNIWRYGSPKPPKYNVSRITSAVVLICAENDWVSSLDDINKLNSKLPNLLEYFVVPDPSWSHNDHLFGVKAPEYVFSKILGYLGKYNV